MTNNITGLLPEGITHDTPALHGLSPAERLKQHRKNLRAIAFTQGVDGAKRYKAEHPEAASVRVEVSTLAYSPKPSGYNDAILHLAERWLTDDNAAAETNKADVGRLNARFGAGIFNPANHLSKPLSSGRLAKLKALFQERGVHLDTSKADTLSKVKAAAKAARGRISADRPFGSVGVITGKTLVIGSRSFGIEQHHGRDCIRVPIDGERVRIRLDALEALIGGLSGGGNSSPNYCLCNIGEPAPAPESPDFDPLPGDQSGEVAPASRPETVEPAPASHPRSLSERIAALKPAQRQHAAACADDDDPLNF